MPIASSMPEFWDALGSNESNSTKALGYVYKNRTTLFTPQQIGSLDKDSLGNDAVGALDTLPDWLEDGLRNKVQPVDQRLTTKEINHINKWPDGKEDLRKNLVKAMDNGQAVTFRWGLHAGDTEVTGFDPPSYDGTTSLKVTFLSPQKNVKVWGVPGLWQRVTVDVG